MAMLGLLPAPTTWVCLFAAPAIVVLLTAAGLLSNAAAFRTSAKSLPPSVFETIKSGRIAVIPDFLSPEFISELRADATKLHESGKFSTDALASYGKNGKFDPRYDRQVLRLGQWQDPTLGNSVLREQFAGVIADVRASLAVGLERPGLARGHATTDFGKGSTEISYTRFGPGAFLKRHLDEHHEELKGRFGWQKPTRRSVSWLVYLNRGWDGARHGGQLRCYERAVWAGSPGGRCPTGTCSWAGCGPRRRTRRSGPCSWTRAGRGPRATAPCTAPWGAGPGSRRCTSAATSTPSQCSSSRGTSSPSGYWWTTPSWPRASTTWSRRTA
ncbi:unnamed protein product, partial [Heterosigma akashiwo]